MRRSPRLLALTATTLVVGVGLMIVFDNTASRVIGVLCLLAFIASGTFLIASPEYLAASDATEHAEGPDRRP